MGSYSEVRKMSEYSCPRAAVIGLRSAATKDKLALETIDAPKLTSLASHNLAQHLEANMNRSNVTAIIKPSAKIYYQTHAFSKTAKETRQDGDGDGCDVENAEAVAYSFAEPSPLRREAGLWDKRHEALADDAVLLLPSATMMPKLDPHLEEIVNGMPPRLKEQQPAAAGGAAVGDEVDEDSDADSDESDEEEDTGFWFPFHPEPDRKISGGMEQKTVVYFHRGGALHAAQWLAAHQSDVGAHVCRPLLARNQPVTNRAGAGRAMRSNTSLSFSSQLNSATGIGTTVVANEITHLDLTMQKEWLLSPARSQTCEVHESEIVYSCRLLEKLGDATVYQVGVGDLFKLRQHQTLRGYRGRCGPCCPGS